MRLIAIAHQLSGEYGTVTAGQEFECRDDIAIELLSSGSVRRPDPPRVLYETKVVVPEAPEVRPRLPFRDMPLPHEEPEKLAPESDPVLPEPDLSEPGAADPGGRGKRKRSDPGR